MRKNTPMKKQSHIRQESERKGKVTSIRLSEEQQKTIQEKAQSSGMTVSNYIVTTAVNGGNKLTPEFMVKMQNIVNDTCAIAVVYAPEKVKTMQKRVNEIWQKLM